MVLLLGAVGVVVALMAISATLYRHVPPNQALIVYGWGGTHIVTGGGRLVLPIVQGSRQLSLETMSFDVAPAQDLFTTQGVAVSVEAVAQIKVKNDQSSIRTAAEQFLNKSPQDREAQILHVMEGHLRGIVGQLTVEDLVKKPEEVAGQVLKTVVDDLNKMGLTIVSFTIKEVSDEQDYIKNMGRPEIAKIRLMAEIAEAEAARDIASKKAEAARQAAEKQAEADQARVIAQTASETKQAEAQRDLNLKKAEYEAEVNRKRAAAEKAFEIANNQAQQEAIAEQVKVSQVEKQEQIRVQELEVQRRELELEATMIKQSLAEQRRIEIMADAERARLAREAAGQADATREQGKAEAEITKLRGEAEADVLRVRGTAEAEVVRAKGKAEADAMQLRADAYGKYNEAAILDRLFGNLPELASAFSAAFQQVDKITIVSTGDGKGASQLTGEVSKMIAQMPEVIETLTGIDVGAMIKRLPAVQASEPVRVPVEDASTEA
ncbi:MAG TPA: SPFH domain-containing protein [Oscillatoriaceae cyanobacterium]